MPAHSNRFPYAGGNAKDASSQPVASNGFVPRNWTSSDVWGTTFAPALNNRESASLRATDEAFPSSHQTSNAFSSGPDTTTIWAQSARPWNTTDSNSTNATIRQTSASPSPARARETISSLHDLANGSSSSTSYRAAIGPAGAFANTRPKPNASSGDASASSFRYHASSLRDSVVEDGNDTNGPPPYSHFSFDGDALASRARASQEHPNAFTTTSAAVSVASSTTSASAAPATTNGSNGNSGVAGLPSYGSFGTLPSSHSHRASLQSTSFPSPAAPANALPHHRNSQPEDPNSLAVAELLRQKLVLEERSSDSALSALGAGFGSGLPAYAQPSPGASFQFNPGSQSWDANGVDVLTQGNPPGLNALAAAAYAETRGSLGSIERGTTPIGNSYRHGNSPRSLGTPANTTGSWSRPSSRDPRASGLLDAGAGNHSNFLQRQPLQTYLHEQQLATASASAAAAASFNNNASIFPNGIGFYPGYRAPMQIPTLGIPLNTPLSGPYIPAPHIPVTRDRDPTQALRSPLLDEFRSSRTNRKYELKDIYNHIVEFSGDQHGSRFIQGKLETANSDEKEHVFREISANTLVLMKDVFGNYVVQKFFEHGNQVQKKYLAEQMRGKMVDLSTQTYACRVVQKALQHILVDQQVALAKELEVDVIRVVKDQNGNHVVQKVIELVPREHIGFIMEAFRGQVRELSAHNFGCRVVQRMLEHGSDEDKAAILAELHANAKELITDQFGNYVAQHVIEKGEPSDRAQMINKVFEELVPMSRHKFASNVVESCIEHGTAADRSHIREELDKVGSDGLPVLQHMIKDQYGNYVIQKLLKQLEGDERRLFAEALSIQLSILKRSARQNAAVDRLAAAVDELTKSNSGRSIPGGRKSSSEANAPASPQLQGDRESTPSLTHTPNTPESSNPPSVSAGPTGGSLVTKMTENKATAAESLDLPDPCSETLTDTSGSTAVLPK